MLGIKNKKDDEYQNVPLKCPRCDIYMKKIRKDGVTIDYCKKCKGMWLDKKEVDKLLKK